MQICVILEIPLGEPEYGFIHKESEGQENLILFPGSQFESEDHCFKIKVDYLNSSVNIISLPCGQGIKCYKLWLWLSRASLEKVCLQISSQFNQSKVHGLLNSTNPVLCGNIYRSAQNKLQIEI